MYDIPLCLIGSLLNPFFRLIHFSGKSIFLANPFFWQIHFSGRLYWPGVLNKDPTVWLDGAMPP